MRLLSVNRNFYFFGIFFATLQLILNILQGILYLQLGIKARYLQSFPTWFLLLNVVAFIGLLILLTYYYYKKYWAALIAVLIFAGASFCHAIVVYFMLTEQRLDGYFVRTYNVLLLTAMIYGAVLIFSSTRKRLWLKISGIFMLILSLALTGLFLWSINSQDFDLRYVLDKIHTGVSTIGALLPIPFILNFQNEAKELAYESGKHSLTKIIKAVVVVMVFFALIPTVQLTRDAIGDVLYQNRPSEIAKKMAEPFEAHTFVNAAGQSLPYRLMKPLNYDPNKNYPLAVCLHHGGGNGIDNVVQIETSQWARTLADSIHREKYPCFIFVPQCPPANSFGGIPNYPEMSDLVFEAIADLEKEFDIDEKRRYVMGTSLGGFGSWHFVGTHPKKFAGAIPVCGGGNPAHAKNMVDTPIWAFHGEKDTNVPVELSRAMIEGIRKSGGNPKYTEFKNKGHGIWKEVNETSGKFEWLFSQRRE